MQPEGNGVQPEDNAVPDTHILESLFKNNMLFKIAFSEFFDNSFDASAEGVAVHIGPIKNGKISFITISDDGVGCGNLLNMVRLGSHSGHTGTLSGRFGVGLKEAAAWLGGQASAMEITSLKNGVVRSIKVDWGMILSSKRWRIPPEHMREESATVNPHRGTMVKVGPCCRRFPEGGEPLQILMDEFGYMFAPALKLGKWIVFYRHGKAPVKVVGWDLPEFEAGTEVEATVDVNGATAHVRAGIVKKGEPNPRPGLTYWHGHRVILSNSGQGCGGMDFSRVCGVVRLDNNFVLTKNKDDIGKDKELTHANVFVPLESMLSKAEDTAHTLVSDAFDKSVIEGLNDAIGLADGEDDAKAKRGKGAKTGTVDPKNTGVRHRRAERTQDGNSFPSRMKARSFKLIYPELGHVRDTGSYDDATGTIALNKSLPLVLEAKEGKHASVRVIQLLAAALVASHVQVKQRMGLHAEADWSTAFAKLTRNLRRFDGKDSSGPGLARAGAAEVGSGARVCAAGAR